MLHSHSRRLRALGAGLATAALAVSATSPALADTSAPDAPYLGQASDFAQTVEAPSIEAQLEHYGDAVIPGRWLVQLDGRSGDQLVRDAKSAGVDVKVTKSFSKTWKGVSVEVDDAKIDRVAGLRGVSGVYPVLKVERPVEDATPEVDYARTMTGADVANDELGFTGAGIKVGIIDSGVDYNHPDLGGSGVNDETRDFPNSRVAYGWDLVGDAYNSGSDDPAAQVPRPDRWPDDCGGHGTHVAGIVGASGEVTGVAPDVTFGSYRVFGCNGSSDTDVIIEAMERAAADGMDVINMSLGASYATWPSYPTAQVADKLVDQGIVVVVSQGNAGTGGTFSGGAPSVAHNVISVGSVDNAQYMADYLTSTGGVEAAYSNSTGAPDFVAGTTYDVVVADPITACENVAPATAPGQALLLQRGTCTFHEKAVAAQAAGYDAALLFNNTAGVINATVEGATPITIPVGSMLQSDGEALIAEIAANGSTTVTIAEGQKRFDNPTGGYQSDFSSYGLAADLTLKPDLSAPGGSIYSTYPLEEGAYATLGGTSMAAPHVAGAAALLLEARPELDPYEVRDILTTTADPFTWGTMPDLGVLEPVHRQGGGLVNIPHAITSTTYVTPGKISLGEGEAGPVTTTVSVTNNSDATQTFEVGVEHGVATYGPSNNPGFYLLEADVEFSANSLTIPAGQTATFTAVIGEDFGVDGAIYGGWITLTSATDQYVVPFAGLSGDYQALTALTAAGMAYAVGEDVFIAQPWHEYTMENGDIPYIYYNLAYPVSAMYVDVYKANPDGTKGAQVHNNFRNYVTYIDRGRLSAMTVLPWDGTYQGNNGNNKTRKVANGDYVLEVRVLKALGDPNNPAHWETLDTTPFTITWGPNSDTDAQIGPNPKGNNGNGNGNGNGKGNNGKGKGNN